MLEKIQAAAAQIGSIVVGKQSQIRLALTCVLARGHLLVEDLPGVGKTTLAHAVAITLGLSLVGRHPPEWLKVRAAETPGVHLFADVPDVRPFLATCGMLAVPLRIGGGSRLKILEALATATPVISTRIGAEGLNLTAGRDLIVTDGHEGMADAIVEGIREYEELRDTAEEGRRKVLARYDWGPLADKLDEVWWTATTTPSRIAA